MKQKKCLMIHLKRQNKIKGFLNEQKETREILKENMLISELIGEVKLWLESVQETDETSELGKQKNKLKNEIKNLEDKISLNERSNRRINILNHLDDILEQWAPEVQLYQAEKYQFKYDVKSITLLYGRDKEMAYSNLGGGHNMLGIHLILYLALHKYFIDKKRPVPNFVIFDQPSTPYFSQDPDKNNITEYFKQDPREKLAKIYKFIIDKTAQIKNLQVIITDQANLTHEKWFEEYLVKDWNGALIPPEWK